VHLPETHKCLSNNFDTLEDIPNQILQKPNLDISENSSKNSLKYSLKPYKKHLGISLKNHLWVSLKVIQKPFFDSPSSLANTTFGCS
jgi:hypothetical protein